MKLFTIVFAFLSLVAYSQIDHWETAVFNTDTWKYIPGTSEPDTNWRKVSFNDASWNSGQGGIGYGDGDDNTIIAQTTSLYMRFVFNVGDTSVIEDAVLNADYDDAFVAYLNNVEIARSNIGTVGTPPPYNQFANGNHEAQMYQGNPPDYFTIPHANLKQILKQGANVLAVQVHNVTANSSDLSSNMFLSFGIKNTNTYFQPTPSWFQPPLNFTSSNLPIVVINTNGQTIQDNVRIVADMGIIHNTGRNYITDPYNNYNGKISIELRGSSSQMFPKKAYSFETQDILGNNNNVSLIDLPVENDWVLYAPYSDKSLMRNVLAYKIGEMFGRYSPRTKFCELVLNGEYMGVYVLLEKIKRDKNRLDIAKLDVDDLAGDSLTGGYIVKIDKTTGGSGYDWFSPYAPNYAAGSQQIGFQYHYPKSTDIQPQQATYIQNYIDSFETVLNGPNFNDPVNGYVKYMDPLSFVDFFILNEISRNVDGYRLSTFLFKDKNSKGGKINMGPYWDFNLAFGNANYCDGSLYNGWSKDFNQVCSNDNYQVPFWWDKLEQDTVYLNLLRCRWENLRLNELHTDSLLAYIDTLANYLNESQQRNFQKWPILGTYVWPNNYIGNTYQDEINYLKTWLINRINWMDNNIPGNCYNVGVNEMTSIENNFLVYPNPANDKFYIKNYSNSQFEIMIYDQIGKMVAQQNLNGFINFVNISNLSNGIYFVVLKQNHLNVTKKLSIQR